MASPRRGGKGTGKSASKRKPVAAATASQKGKRKKKTPAAKPAKPTRTGKPAKAVAPPPRKRVRTPRVSRDELERRLAKARAGAASLEGRWMRALERMRVHLSDPIGRDLVLRAAKPPAATKGTPWALVARFAGWDGRASYSELYLGLKATEGDEQVERGIGARRYARIVVLYDGVEERGGSRRVEREFTLAEIAPWEFCISRAVERCNPDSEEGLVASYDQGKGRTLIRALYVWISAEEARDIAEGGF